MEAEPLFAGVSDIALATIALAVAGALGLAFGAVRVAGVGLGIGGVLFAGLLVGHVSSAAGIVYDADVMEFVREFGLIIFVYTIGVQVGPGFFASLKRSGLRLNLIAVCIVALGVATTVAIHVAAGIEVPALVGVMSGAVTNTPGLGAATQVLKDAGLASDALAQPSLGYAVAYPFGIIGILITMLAIRAVFRIDVAQEAEAFDAAYAASRGPLPSLDVTVTNPNIDGLALADIPGLSDEEVVASRLRRRDELIAPADDVRVARGDALHLVGPAEKLEKMRLILGEEAAAPLTTKGAAITWARIVVTATRALGKRLRALALMESHGVRVSRVHRSGAELVARGDTALQFGDILTVVGPRDGIAAARGVLGDQKGRLDEVDFRALFVGIGLGLLLGMIPIYAPGLPAPLKLGLAGGPLVAAILLARLGHFGPLVWFMPPVANHALRELGIILFLAVVGIRAGDRFLATLIEGDGLLWMAHGAVVTLVPLMVMGFAARLLLKLDYLSLCGVLAGSMTDPPALAFANALSPSPAPSLAYATVYPLVMFLRILAPQALVLFLL